MSALVDFFQSLSTLGYIVIALVALCVWNLKSLMRLRSPLDSWQHKIWRSTCGETPPDHLEQRDKEI